MSKEITKAYDINLPNEGTFYCVRVMQSGTPRYDLVGGNPISSENPLNIYGYNSESEAVTNAIEYFEKNNLAERDIELLYIDIANYKRWERTKKQYVNWETYEAQFVASWASLFNMCRFMIDNFGDRQYYDKYFASAKKMKKSFTATFKDDTYIITDDNGEMVAEVPNQTDDLWGDIEIYDEESGTDLQGLIGSPDNIICKMKKSFEYPLVIDVNGREFSLQSTYNDEFKQYLRSIIASDREAVRRYCNDNFEHIGYTWYELMHEQFDKEYDYITYAIADNYASYIWNTCVFGKTYDRDRYFDITARWIGGGDMNYINSQELREVKSAKNKKSTKKSLKKSSGDFTESEIRSLCPHATRIFDHFHSGSTFDVIWDLPSGNHPGIFISDHGPIDDPVYVCWMTANRYLDFQEPDTPDGNLPYQFEALATKIYDRVEEGNSFDTSDRLPKKDEVAQWLREMDELCAERMSKSAKKMKKSSDEQRLIIESYKLAEQLETYYQDDRDISNYVRDGIDSMESENLSQAISYFDAVYQVARWDDKAEKICSGLISKLEELSDMMDEDYDASAKKMKKSQLEWYVGMPLIDFMQRNRDAGSLGIGGRYDKYSVVCDGKQVGSSYINVPEEYAQCGVQSLEYIDMGYFGMLEITIGCPDGVGKSYTPEYHDFRTMLTNMKMTKDNRTVFKR